MPSDPARFFVDLAAGFRSAMAVFAANDLGVFAALSDGPASVESVADRIGADPRAVPALLEALSDLDLLERDGDRFRNAALASAHLVPGQPGFVGHNLTFQSIAASGWLELAGVVRSGRPWRSLGELMDARDPTFTAEYIRAMIPVSRRHAQAVAEALGDEPLEAMADVGCGPGLYAAALLERHRALVANLVDLEQALPVTREVMAAQPDRVRFVPGDYRQVEYGTDLDLVVMSHVTHNEGPEAVAEMARRAHRALRPGGRVAIHDWVLGPPAENALWSSLFALQMLVYTEGGRVYRLDEYREILERTGFSDVAAVPVLSGSTPNPTTLVTARRPV